MSNTSNVPVQDIDLDAVFAEAAAASGETASAPTIESTEGKKTKKDREGLKSIKKERAPHVMTEARKLAFEKCQAARREKLALKKSQLAVQS